MKCEYKNNFVILQRNLKKEYAVLLHILITKHYKTLKSLNKND